MAEYDGAQHPLSVIIEGTPERTFDQAGGFDFIDELAVALDAQWKNQKVGAVLVSRMELAWLLDGYARARMAPPDTTST